MATTLTKFKGGAELQAMLNTLPAKIEKNILRSALRQGANVMKDAAKAQLTANGNVETGELLKSIKVKTRTKRGQVTATIETGDRKAHWIEFGTEPHEITPRKPGGALSFGDTTVQSVQHPGTKPQPFMQPAVDSKTNEAILAIGEQIRKRLTKEGINTPAGLEIDDE